MMMNRQFLLRSTEDMILHMMILDQFFLTYLLLILLFEIIG